MTEKIGEIGEIIAATPALRGVIIHKADWATDAYYIDAWVDIRRNSDGVIRREKETHTFYGPFIWAEGNYHCDCNRFLFFTQVADEDYEGDDDDHPCGHTEYSVRITSADFPDVVLYQDGERW